MNPIRLHLPVTMPSGGITLFKYKKSPKSPKAPLPTIDDDSLSVPEAGSNTEAAHLPIVHSGESLSSLATDASNLHIRETPGSGLGLFDSATATPIERARSPLFGFVRSREQSPERLDDEKYVSYLLSSFSKHSIVQTRVLNPSLATDHLNTFDPARVGGNTKMNAKSGHGGIFRRLQHARHTHPRPLENTCESPCLVNKKQPMQKQR